MQDPVLAKLGFGLVCLCVAVTGKAQPVEAAGRLEVRCAEGRAFFAERDEKYAVVTYEGRRIILTRRPLELGSYYRSEEAVLIVDGDFVAFIPEHDRSWRECRLAPG
jgi:hypothetical protein